MLSRNRIDYGRAYMPQLQDHAEAVIFPYFRNGELVNRKYRTLHEKHFRLETGCELVLYGLDDIDAETPLIYELKANSTNLRSKLPDSVASFLYRTERHHRLLIITPRFLALSTPIVRRSSR